MRLASVPFLANPRGTSPWRRLATLALVVLVHALLLFLLLRLAPPLPPQKPGLGPITVELIPAPQAEEERSPEKRQEKPKKERKKAETPKREPPPVRPVDIVDRTSSAIWGKVTHLTREEFAIADIADKHSEAAAPAGTQGDSEGENQSAQAGGGGGPHGEQLYDAQWYRKPSSAELSAYLPTSGPRVGWGMIACRTVADYRVEDCQEIGQSPPGSGLARAVREAAWQFRVLPPRIGGRPLVGAWVRIRIDYSQTAQP